MSEDGHENKETQTLIALALLQQRMDDIIKRLDDQSRTAASQAASLSQEFKHSISNAEQRWMAELQARSAVNDQKLLAINTKIDGKAGQTEFKIVRGIVFGLVALVLASFATAVTRSVIAHEASPAVGVAQTSESIAPSAVSIIRQASDETSRPVGRP